MSQHGREAENTSRKLIEDILWVTILTAYHDSSVYLADTPHHLSSLKWGHFEVQSIIFYVFHHITIQHTLPPPTTTSKFLLPPEDAGATNSYEWRLVPVKVTPPMLILQACQVLSQLLNPNCGVVWDAQPQLASQQYNLPVNSLPQIRKDDLSPGCYNKSTPETFIPSMALPSGFAGINWDVTQPGTSTVSFYVSLEWLWGLIVFVWNTIPTSIVT